jgi:hypothetical protein
VNNEFKDFNKALGLAHEPEELVGVHQDLILEWYGRPYRITKVGKDENGLIVNWHYKDFKLQFARVTGEDPVHKTQVTAYFVTQVFSKKAEENHANKKSNGRERNKQRKRHHRS